MKQLASDLWVAEGETVSFYHCPFTTRMVVIRLQSGGLWLHSPIAFSPELAEQLAAEGTVKYLVAPNHLHHLYLADWIERYPDACVCGTEEVIQKRPDLHFDCSLNQELQWPWREDIAQRLVSGSKLMQECVFFHHSSRTLIVTDLIENFPKGHFTGWRKLFAKGAGIIAPNGKTPLDWRLSFKKAAVKPHIEHIRQWHPDRIIMSHGEIVAQDAEVFLQRSFRWVL